MEHLFVYGTLRRSTAPPQLRALVEGWRWLGEAWVAGRLYDLGPYPGAVLDDAGAERIFGELVELPGDPALWRRLDRYEGFDARRPEWSLFRRVRCEVQGCDAPREAWIYVCGREPAAEHSVVRGGRWSPPYDSSGPRSGRSR
jgi:gamma-glutamylcyclotransferase (GGCT)/AIG2-like uncharacterized protein YtfP